MHGAKVKMKMTTFIIEPSLRDANNHRCNYKVLKTRSTVFRRQ
jgi:hypothetical protein